VAQFVLLVIAGIAGFVAYSEAARIEKRFRRGPLGLPAPVWGVACFLCAGVIGVLVAAEVVIGALVGYVAYTSESKYAGQHGEGPMGVPPYAVGVACACLGLIGALCVSTFPLWAIFGLVGYNEAAQYERHYGKYPFGVSALVWGVACFFFGLIGTFVTSALVWAAVCALLGLVGAHLLLLVEKQALIAEKAALLAENTALLAEKNTRRPNTVPPRAEPAPRPAAPAPAPAPVAQQPPPRVLQGGRIQRPPGWGASPPSGWSSPQPAPPRGGNGTDLLPHR